MKNRLRLAIWVAPSLIATALGTSLLSKFVSEGSETLNYAAGWTIICVVVVSLIGVATAWIAALKAAPEAELTSESVESQFGRALEYEASAKYSFVSASTGMSRQVNLRFRKIVASSRDHGGSVTGDLASILAYFESLSPGRLVVLGGPGAGKTTLALELQMQMLKSRRRNQDDLFPVLVEAAHYILGRTWENWMTEHLTERYSLSGQTATQLISGGRILPIIDGLDELERTMAAALITELNAYGFEQELSQGGDWPAMILTCRESEYHRLVEPLNEATHIEIEPLSTVDVRRCLQDHDIETSERLDSVLVNPLMLSLTVAAYGVSSIDGSSVDDLARLPDEIAVERHLLSAFLNNAYQTRSARNWSSAQSAHWLASVGSQMRVLSTDGYSWRQVAHVMSPRNLGFLSGAVTGFCLLATLGVLGITHHVFGQRVPLETAIVSLILVCVSLAAASGLLTEVFFSDPPEYLTLTLTGASLRWSQAATVVALAVSEWISPAARRKEFRSKLVTQEKGESDRGANLREDLHRARTHALGSAAIAGGILGALAVALVLVGVHIWRDATIIFVCYCMVVIVLCTPWGSFELAKAWFSAQGRLPYRLLEFLHDAEERGVLRSVGPRFEFRNNALREYFSDPARLPKVEREIIELTNWVLGNLEIRESYRNVGASKADIAQAISSLATEMISAKKPFTSAISMHQPALERVRIRLNQLGRRSAFNEFLVAREAPGLGSAIDPSRIILTRTMNDLTRLVYRLPSASVGISGVRGIGKSTLIRWLCMERNSTHRFPILSLYVTAPVEYDARDFLVHLYVTLCRAVLSDDRLTAPRIWTRLRRAALVVVLVIAGFGFYYHHGVDDTVTTYWVHRQADLWYLSASGLFTAALFTLLSIIHKMWRARGGGRKKTNLGATARNRLQHLRYQVVETSGRAGHVAGPFGLSFSGSRSRQVTANQMTLPELVDSYREFAELTVTALQESVRRKDPSAGAQVRLIVGIDEIDRIEDAANAERFLNDIKAIFGISNCFYVASLSADALANFERRVVNTRTAFDTTFDTVMRIGPLELGTARQVLELRAIGLPFPFITLCYILSGGVPRELMRIARRIFDVRNDIPFEFLSRTDEGAVACATIAPQVIAREMESLRQGLMPMAIQLKVSGAAELIGLLDDPEWPSGDMQDDLAKLTQIIKQRTLFQDETGSIAAAANICDGLAAACYFLFTVDELFRTRLDQIVADLRRYDATPSQSDDPVGCIHLLARARAAIGVNPALSITRVRAARKYYRLSDLAPALLSQLHADSANS